MPNSDRIQKALEKVCEELMAMDEKTFRAQLEKCDPDLLALLKEMRIEAPPEDK